MGPLVGSGAHGKVHRGLWRGRKVAVKASGGEEGGGTGGDGGAAMWVTPSNHALRLQNSCETDRVLLRGMFPGANCVSWPPAACLHSHLHPAFLPPCQILDCITECNQDVRDTSAVGPALEATIRWAGRQCVGRHHSVCARHHTHACCLRACAPARVSEHNCSSQCLSACPMPRPPRSLLMSCHHSGFLTHSRLISCSKDLTHPNIVKTLLYAVHKEVRAACCCLPHAC